jgi:DNA-binding MarR family transcriptional regulator
VAQDFTQCLPYMLRTTTQVLYQQMERTLRPHELTQAQLAVLAQLGMDPDRGTSGADLAHGAGMTAQAMSTAIAGLLERGLVDRTPHPTHGRVLEVRITPAGAELLDLAQEATIAVERRAVAQLSTDEQAELKRLVGQIMETLGLRTAPLSHR